MRDAPRDTDPDSTLRVFLRCQEVMEEADETQRRDRLGYTLEKMKQERESAATKRVDRDETRVLIY